MRYSFKQKLGAILYDLPRFLWSMRPSSRHTWVFMRNRDERLAADASGTGAECRWQWSSDVHIARVFPSLGRLLMNRAVRDWPIQFQEEPSQLQEERSEREQKVQVSFVIGHRGVARLPHLLLTLKSIAAQREILFECIVVEQSASPEAKEHLPSWVRYIHTPLDRDMPFSRAWAFNVGARAARGEVLVLHDNDMLVPVDYAKEIILRSAAGYEVINLKRFIFYLTEAHSAAVLSGEEPLSARPPEAVVQNLEGGGSLAVTRDAYFAIGGLDEAFVGWGGEDSEFWERAQTRCVWRYSYMPVVHLWHPAQPHKAELNNPNLQRYHERSSSPVEERIRELTMSNFGSTRCSIEDVT